MITVEAGSEAVPVHSSHIRKVEDEIGVRFPHDYLGFIATTNGGVPLSPYFDLGDNTKVVERFLSFVLDYKHDPLGCYDVEVVWSQVEDRLPVGVVPIAALFAGDLLCIDTSAGDSRIVFWVHDLEPETVIPVADSFQAFSGMLHA